MGRRKKRFCPSMEHECDRVMNVMVAGVIKSILDWWFRLRIKSDWNIDACRYLILIQKSPIPEPREFRSVDKDINASSTCSLVHHTFHAMFHVGFFINIFLTYISSFFSLSFLLWITSTKLKIFHPQKCIYTNTREFYSSQEMLALIY